MNPSLGPSDDVHSLRGAQASTLRPLSAIAATRKGGVPERRIGRILVELAGPLSALHRSGRIHGAITYDSIGLDAHGRADLIVPALSLPRCAGDTALRAGRASGFNAFEQYTDDPAWPVGPWTDVYALCATACRLITGAEPPSAIDRCVRDSYVPLAHRGLKDYSPSLLAMLDRGLAMRPQDRPAGLMPLLVATGLSEQAAEQVCREGELFDALEGGQDAPGPALDMALMAGASLAHPRPPRDSRLPACRLLRGSTPWFVVPIGLAMALLGMWYWLQSQPLVRGDTRPPGFFPAQARSDRVAGVMPAAGSVLQAPSSGARPVPESSTPARIEPAPSALSGRAPPASEPGRFTPELPPSEPGRFTPEPPALSDLMPEADAGQTPAGTPAAGAGAPAAQIPAAANEISRQVPAVLPVRVAVDIQPWGELYIDGVKRGVSPPLRQISLAPGTYRVSIRNPHARAHQYALTVPAGRSSVAIKHQFPLD